MPDLDDQPQTLTIAPPLDPTEVAVVAGLAGVGGGVRRVWPGQPGRRSPWLPCADGCCLVVEQRPEADPATWLRFLVRELFDPRARVPRQRAAELGLPGGHRLEGRVLLTRCSPPRLLVAVGRQVRVVPLDEDLFPVERVRRRPEGEVVELGERRRQSTER